MLTFIQISICSSLKPKCLTALQKWSVCDACCGRCPVASTFWSIHMTKWPIGDINLGSALYWALKEGKVLHG
jgi:hypothetical protein